MKAKHGRVTYGSRAFHQDATEAMAGDIVRAVIETITNSDDAYASKSGKIKIEIEQGTADVLIMGMVNRGFQGILQTAAIAQACQIIV